ncbi:MAG: hypothetical protein IKU28_02335, partial [Erysipelotrichaceae bacterium]|nr:hypothetical protein [Erysipelotrichaceae bacterium]
MKKNKMMRLASSLLVAVLLTSSVISGTFAKYVTSDSAEDSARVAKWGITVLASGNLFGTDYNPNDGSATADRITATSTNVSSDNTEDIVAPGTLNDEGVSFVIKGADPEVAYDVTAKVPAGTTVTDIYLNAGKYGVMVEATGLNAATNLKGYYSESSGTYTLIEGDVYWTSGTYYELHDYVELANTYYPLVWTFNDGVNPATEHRNLASVVDDVVITKLDALAGNAKQAINVDYSLTWSWPFSGQND